MDVTKSYSIAFKGLKNGIHTFDFDVDGSLFEAYGSTEIKGGSCKVHVVLDRAETMLAVDTTIDGAVIVECDRCLEDCEVPVHFAGRLLVKFSDEADDYDGEVMWIAPSVGEIDLTQYIYESIVLSLPYQRVHPEGQCDPAMLERFRIVSEPEFAAIEAQAEAEAEERAAGQSGEWAKLEALREQMTREVAEKVLRRKEKEE